MIADFVKYFSKDFDTRSNTEDVEFPYRESRVSACGQTDRQIDREKA